MNYDSLYLNPFQYVYVTPLFFMENKTKRFSKSSMKYIQTSGWLLFVLGPQINDR